MLNFEFIKNLLRKDKDTEDPKQRKIVYKNRQELPTKFFIEACNICNLRCPLCWQAEADKQNVEFGYLKFKYFKKFVDNNIITEVSLASLGEIFLNPELLDIIKYAYKKKIKLNAKIGVNLNRVSDEMIKALVKYRFEQMTVSIDGASPETYIQYRVGGNFNTVIDNIKRINYYKEKYSSKYPILDYKMVIFGHNQHEIQKAKQLAKELNMNIIFSCNDWDPSWHPISNVEKVLEEINA